MSFDQIATRKELESVAAKMKERNFEAVVVASKSEALAKLKELLPEGAQVMTGSSTTLKEIGFSDYLASTESKLVSLQEKINGENDESKRQTMRRHAVTADYFLASANAVTKDGIIVAVDATGSRVGAMPFAAGRLILVIGAQKVSSDLQEAMQRVRKHVFPLEDARALNAYGMNSSFGKWVIMEKEAFLGRVTVILVEEALGF